MSEKETTNQPADTSDSGKKPMDSNHPLIPIPEPDSATIGTIQEGLQEPGINRIIKESSDKKK